MFCILVQVHVTAQKVMRLADARTIGLTTEHMDSLYKSAFNVQDSTKAAFPDRMDEFMVEFEKVLHAMGDRFNKEGFKFGKDTRLTYRSFFAADGKMEAFHYYLKEPMSAEQEETFRRILEGFVDEYRFPMKADVPFRQCGTVTFKDKQK